MIRPTYVPAVLRKFNLDVVDMHVASQGYRYIVDIRDDLTGWLEARRMSKNNSKTVAEFLWQDVICRFGCIPQITTDNGSEFKKAAQLLVKQYKIPMIKISPYNPAGNGMIKRGHEAWIPSIWKLAQGKPKNWSRWFYPAMWADRTTTRQSTGYSPFQMLYGVPHIFPFNLEDKCWFTINWRSVQSTRDLIAMRALQLAQLELDRSTAAANTIAVQQRAADDYARRNQRQLISGIYRENEMVLVWQKRKAINEKFKMAKSDDKWSGPYRIGKAVQGGSYILRELNGAWMRGSIPARHLKPFRSRMHQIGEPFLFEDRVSMHHDTSESETEEEGE